MFIKSSLCGVLTLLSTTSAFALSCLNDYGGTGSCTNANPAGDCTTLGYSKDNVSGCEHYLYCPFDTAYKRCVTQTGTTADCSDYPLSSCPTGAVCSACGTGSGSNITIRYMVTACQAGYTKSGNTCVVATCSGYTLSSCPANGSCTSCLSGTTTKYKLNSCNSGYVMSGNSCVANFCSSGFAKTAADCGTTGTKGWTLGTDTDAAGCKKCEKKTCPTGTSVGCNVHSYKISTTNSYQGNTQCIKCTTCPNNGYAIGSGKGGCDSGQIRVESSDPKCYECKTGYDREQYGCNIEHAITVDADGNPTSDKYFDHCSCYWDDGYCNTAWVEEHGLCKKGDTHCFYCPGPGCSGGW